MNRSILLFVFGLACGCGGDAGRVEVFPVSGSVIVDEVPVAGVQLSFLPQRLGAELIFPRTTTMEGGRFEFSTYEPGDGIPAGEYVVTASWRPLQSTDPEEIHPDETALSEERLEPRYLDPERSPLLVVVERKQNELTPFIIESARSAGGKRRWNE